MKTKMCRKGQVEKGQWLRNVFKDIRFTAISADRGEVAVTISEENMPDSLIVVSLIVPSPCQVYVVKKCELSVISHASHLGRASEYIVLLAPGGLA